MASLLPLKCPTKIKEDYELKVKSAKERASQYLRGFGYYQDSLFFSMQGSHPFVANMGASGMLTMLVRVDYAYEKFS